MNRFLRAGTVTVLVMLASMVFAMEVVGAEEDADGNQSASIGKTVRIVSPYAGIDWDKVACVPSFSHEHGQSPQVFWEMGFRHLPLSNYYPSRPIHPLPDAFVKTHPEALGSPNAEQHSTTDAGVHFNVIGSFYTTGYGQTPRIKADHSPVEHVFSGLQVFDAEHSPWLGVYRLDLTVVAQTGTDKEAAVSLTIDGATEVRHKDFAAVGDGVMHNRRLIAKKPWTIYLKAESDKMRVRLEFDPASTKITRFRLMQGTNRPWRDAFRAALDGTLKDEQGRPIEGLLYPDGGGITINHPTDRLPVLLDMLDFDQRVLGIEVWNQHEDFGVRDKTFMALYRRWDEILRTGRRCYGFFVKDHMLYGRGRNILLLGDSVQQTRQEREHEALRAYREGCFFGLLGALAVDTAGKVVPPYDRSEFRFTRIAVKEDNQGSPTGVEVAVDGADRTKRPNTQIRFVTDVGVAQAANTDRASFALPRDLSGKALCRYIRVEAFAYPNTHLGRQPLTAEAFSAMNVREIARIHDREREPPLGIEVPGPDPIPIVDMLFSQPLLVRGGDDGRPAKSP